MSTFDSDDLGGPCHVLTEDGVRRLWQLRDHLAFLSQLAQPGIADEEAATRSEGALGELPVFLALVAEQVDRVSAAVLRSGRGGSKKANDAYATAGAGAGAVDERFSFGLTMDQMDALNRLAALLSAHGDVVSASETTVFVDHTLPVVGQAIFEGAQAVGEILREVEVDQFLWARPSATGVREERAVYAAVSVHEPWPLAAAMPDDASLLH